MTIVHLATFLQGGAGRVLVDLVADPRRVQAPGPAPRPTASPAA